MLMICLRILSILGMILLVLLATAAVFLLLVLFVPVTYRISGEKNEEGFRVSAGIRWLLGLIRVRCDYPDPGYLVVRVFLFTLYRTKIPPDEGADVEDKGRLQSRKRKSRKKNRKEEAQPKGGEAGTEALEAEEKNADAAERKNPSPESGNVKEAEADMGGQKEEAENETSREQTAGLGKILQKFQKIKYTIGNICDKIKEIWNNISYYLELLQEEPTRQFLADVRLRAGKMMKSVMPRHIKADIRFGTGSPDTTGYLYGAYCMVFPTPGSRVNVIPDFEEAVFQGEFAISGHVTAGILLWNLCRMVLDRRLRQLIRKARIPVQKRAGKEAA